MKNTVFISLLFLVLSGFTVSKRVDAMIEKEVKAVFDIEHFSKSEVPLSNEIKAQLPIEITAENFIKINNAESHLGYYFLGKAYGKADYFDFIVIFDADLVVSKVKVLVYREEHGGEIKSNRWLRQFIGTSNTSELKYQKDIAGISGATISAKAMTYEVNKILKTVNILYTNNQL